MEWLICWKTKLKTILILEYEKSAVNNNVQFLIQTNVIFFNWSESSLNILSFSKHHTLGRIQTNCKAHRSVARKIGRPEIKPYEERLKG